MIVSLLQRLAKVAWLLPGFLLWAAFPPLGERTDALFALAPLLWFARTESVRKSARQWFLNGLVFWGATLSWMPAIVKNGGPWPLVALGWAALAAYCALYFGAFGGLAAAYWNWTRDRGYGWRLTGLVIVEPVLWAGLELVRSRLFGGFAWNHLGVVAVTGGFGAPAAWGGVYLVSALVLLLNGTIASIAERMLAPFRRQRARVLELKGGAVAVDPDSDPASAPSVPNGLRSVETLLPFLLVFAVYRFAAPEPSESDAACTPVNVALVQRNFPCVFQRQEESPVDVYSNLVAHVAELEPDLVVLSESAQCEFGDVDSPRARGFALWLSRLTRGASVLAGGSRRGEDGAIYNSAALYSADGVQIYDKVHLVPFGEYIPGDKLIPALQKLAPVGSCTAGEPQLLNVGTRRGDRFPVGVAICFEDTDSALVREFARKGARLLAFITNDSWFSRSDEAVQHAAQAVARAIETGLPVVRVGNSGVTGVIRPDGSTTLLTDAVGRPLVDARATLFDRIPVETGETAGRTVYVAVGDMPLALLFSLLILFLIMIEYKNHEKRRRVSL